MKEMLVAAMLLALWVSLLVTDVRAYFDSPKEKSLSDHISVEQ